MKQMLNSPVAIHIFPTKHKSLTIGPKCFNLIGKDFLYVIDRYSLGRESKLSFIDASDDLSNRENAYCLIQLVFLNFHRRMRSSDNERKNCRKRGREEGKL